MLREMQNKISHLESLLQHEQDTKQIHQHNVVDDATKTVELAQQILELRTQLNKKDEEIRNLKEKVKKIWIVNSNLLKHESSNFHSSQKTTTRIWLPKMNLFAWKRSWLKVKNFVPDWKVIHIRRETHLYLCLTGLHIYLDIHKRAMHITLCICFTFH